MVGLVVELPVTFGDDTPGSAASGEAVPPRPVCPGEFANAGPDCYWPVVPCGVRVTATGARGATPGGRVAAAGRSRAERSTVAARTRKGRR